MRQDRASCLPGSRERCRACRRRQRRVHKIRLRLRPRLCRILARKPGRRGTTEPWTRLCVLYCRQLFADRHPSQFNLRTLNAPGHTERAGTLSPEEVHAVKRNNFGIAIVSILCLLAAGCSSGKTTTTTTGGGGGFQITQPTTSPAIDVSQSVTFTANQAALWSLQSGNSNKPLGTLSNTTTAATTVTYTAPSSVTGAREVIVVATSTTD